MSPANMKLLYHIVLPVATNKAFLLFKPFPHCVPLKTVPTYTGTQVDACAINLNSLFSWGQLHFLLFCCTVIFHQDVNLTF